MGFEFEPHFLLPDIVDPKWRRYVRQLVNMNPSFELNDLS